MERREQVKPGAGLWTRKEGRNEKAPLEVLSTGSERVREECGRYEEEKAHVSFRPETSSVCAGSYWILVKLQKWCQA